MDKNKIFNILKVLSLERSLKLPDTESLKYLVELISKQFKSIEQLIKSKDWLVYNYDKTSRYPDIKAFIEARNATGSEIIDDVPEWLQEYRIILNKPYLENASQLTNYELKKIECLNQNEKDELFKNIKFDLANV